MMNAMVAYARVFLQLVVIPVVDIQNSALGSSSIVGKFRNLGEGIMTQQIVPVINATKPSQVMIELIIKYLEEYDNRID